MSDEMNDDSWFQPVKRIIKNKWTTIWTKKHVGKARSWVANGAVTQIRICGFGWTTDGKCQRCDTFRTEVHCLYECRHWRRIRNDLTDEVRMDEQIAKTSASAKMLWGRCNVSNDPPRGELRISPGKSFRVGPWQDLKRLPWVRPRRMEQYLGGCGRPLHVWRFAGSWPHALTPSAVSGR